MCPTNLWRYPKNSSFTCRRLRSAVTVDCRGRSISHQDPANDAFGITGGGFGPVHDVKVRACKLVDFGTGIVFGPGSDRVEIAGNDIVRPKLDGIVLWGSNSRITGNSVLATSNPFYDYSRNITVTAFQPGVRSTGNVISGNTVAGAHGNGTIWGIRVDMSDDVLINNNNVLDLQPKDGGYAAAIVTDSPTSRIMNNVMMSRVGTNYGNMGSAAICFIFHKIYIKRKFHRIFLVSLGLWLLMSGFIF